MLPNDQVRKVKVSDALIDSGATGLLVPRRIIAQLGLRPFQSRQARHIGGLMPMTMYQSVRLTIQGRDCPMDVGELADEFPVVIGQVPLELLDWVVDPKNHRLIGNPEHGGEHVMEVFCLRPK